MTYEIAIIFGLASASFIFAYIASLINEDKNGIIKLLFLSVSAGNVWILINVCGQIANTHALTTIETMIYETSNVIFLYAIYAAGIWLFALFIIWIVKTFIQHTQEVKEPGI